jgi:hypothetical protein
MYLKRSVKVPFGTFQVFIERATGQILMRYPELLPGDAATGGSATIGEEFVHMNIMQS